MNASLWTRALELDLELENGRQWLAQKSVDITVANKGVSVTVIHR